MLQTNLLGTTVQWAPPNSTKTLIGEIVVVYIDKRGGISAVIKLLSSGSMVEEPITSLISF